MWQGLSLHYLISCCYGRAYFALRILDETASISEQFQFWVLKGNVHRVQPAQVNFICDLLTVMIGHSSFCRLKGGGVQCLHSLKLDPWVFAKQSLIVSHPGVGQPLILFFRAVTGWGTCAFIFCPTVSLSASLTKTTVAANARRHGGHPVPLDPVMWTGM